jgi:hypothetical protein
MASTEISKFEDFVNRAGLDDGYFQCPFGATNGGMTPHERLIKPRSDFVKHLSTCHKSFCDNKLSSPPVDEWWISMEEGAELRFRSPFERLRDLYDRDVSYSCLIA